MTRFVPRPARRLYRRIVPAPTPPPQSAGTWDDEYAQGRWDYLDSVDEMAHYMVLLGYASFAPERPRVLDVGCGHGRLLQVLQRLPYGSYVGVDASKVAVARATALGAPNATFELASFEEWSPGAAFDVVIFNESIYYAADPHALARQSRLAHRRRAAPHLALPSDGPSTTGSAVLEGRDRRPRLRGRGLDDRRESPRHRVGRGCATTSGAEVTATATNAGPLDPRR